jgi:hypothetical protein
MRRILPLVLLSTAVSLASCSPQAVPCPAIAQASVVALTIPRHYADSVKSVHLQACQDGICKAGELDLQPGMKSVDQGCEPGGEPDGSCSATATPDGTKVGMLMLDVLTESRIDATATGVLTSGAAIPERNLSFTPRSAYPFGEQCGRFLTANVILDEAGLRQGE